MTTLSVRITEAASRPLGHAIVTATGLPANLQTVEFALSRHGYAANHLGPAGWQGAECWLQPEEAWYSEGMLQFVLGPDLVYQLESMPYSLALRGQGLAGETRVTFIWPLELEPETTADAERVMIGGTKIHSGAASPAVTSAPLPAFEVPTLGPAEISIPELAIPAGRAEAAPPVTTAPSVPPVAGPTAPPPLPIPEPVPAQNAAGAEPRTAPDIAPPPVIPAVTPPEMTENTPIIAPPPPSPVAVAAPEPVRVDAAAPGGRRRSAGWLGALAALGVLVTAALIWWWWQGTATPPVPNAVVPVPLPAGPGPATPAPTPPVVATPPTPPVVATPPAPPVVATPPTPPVVATPPAQAHTTPPAVSPPPLAIPATPPPPAPPATSTPPPRVLAPAAVPPRAPAGGNLEQELKKQFESKQPPAHDLERELESRLKQKSPLGTPPVEKKSP